MEKISWTDRVKSEQILYRIKKEGIILNTIKKRKTTWIGHILRRTDRLKYVFEGKINGRIEIMGRRGRKCK
jgi:hypothetical protein